jgi:RNA polymerase-binding transcription factor DksA
MMTRTELKSLMITLRTSHRRITDIFRTHAGEVAIGQTDLASAALRRVAEGTYGCCIRCHKEICMKRLSALPHASFCVTCQEDTVYRGSGVVRPDPAGESNDDIDCG